MEFVSIPSSCKSSRKGDPLTVFKEIKKRDGRVAAFDKGKITDAIFKAARAVGGENYSLAEELTEEVINYLTAEKIPGLTPAVEEIQDAVEKVLIEKGHARTSKAYILYRDKRTRIREAKSEIMDVVKDILVEGKRSAEDHTSSPAQKMYDIALAASQKYYLDNLLPRDIAEAHRQGNFYIHHLGYYSKTFDSMHLDPHWLQNAVISMEKSPSLSFYSSLMNLAGVLQRSRGDMSGEQNLPFFDSLLGDMRRSFGGKVGGAEYAAGLKAFLRCFYSLGRHNMAGMTLDLNVGLGLDTTEECKECTRFFLNELLNGKDKIGHPRIVFSLMEGINFSPQDPNYDLFLMALRVAMRWGNPAFCFLDASYNAPLKEKACYFPNGLRIGENIHGQAGGEGRGNIATVTVNLPRLALAAQDEELFFVELDLLLRLGIRQLLHRFEVLSALHCSDLPYIMGKGHYMGSPVLSPEESIREALKNGIMTLGIIGLPELLRLFLPGKKESDEECYLLVVRVLDHISRRIISFREEYGLNFALASLPGERRLQYFIERDRENFGLIRGVTDKEFYSPGFLLFQEDEALEKKIILEAELHRRCSAGSSGNLFLSPGIDPEGAAEFLRKLAAADLGYVALHRTMQ